MISLSLFLGNTSIWSLNLLLQYNGKNSMIHDLDHSIHIQHIKYATIFKKIFLSNLYKFMMNYHKQIFYDKKTMIITNVNFYIMAYYNF